MLRPNFLSIHWLCYDNQLRKRQDEPENGGRVIRDRPCMVSRSEILRNHCLNLSQNVGGTIGNTVSNDAQGSLSVM